MEKQNYILHTYEALGTVWYIEVFDHISDSKKNELQKIVIDYIQEFEAKYSRFRKDSLLTLLNTKRHISYDTGMAEMLKYGEHIRSLTNGVFNLFILDKITEKGYGQNLLENFSPRVDDDATLQSKAIIRDTEIILQGSLSIDLGGIGKGYLIDRVKELLESHGIKQFLINGGGDMYATHHNNAPIMVYMQHPKNHDEYIGTLMLKNQSFCSSSSYMRTWHREGKRMNHFITRDGKEIWAASYVVGDTGVVADVAATVLTICAYNEKKVDVYAKALDVHFLVVQDTNELFGDLSYEPVLQ